VQKRLFGNKVTSRLRLAARPMPTSPAHVASLLQVARAAEAKGGTMSNLVALARTRVRLRPERLQVPPSTRVFRAEMPAVAAAMGVVAVVAATRAFSGKVETGFPQENATHQKARSLSDST
jgi:hypothetical protein